MDGLMNLFGGDMSGLNELLTPEQRAAMQRQGALSMAAQLLAASGPSRTPVNLGQALGQAYMAGQQGYNNAQQQALTGMLTKQKIQEYKRQQDMNAAWRQALTGVGTDTAPGATAPAMRVGPTPERAAMVPTIGAQQALASQPRVAAQAPSVGAAGDMSLRQYLQSLPRAQRESLLSVPAEKGFELINQRLASRVSTLSPSEARRRGFPVGSIVTETADGAMQVVHTPDWTWQTRPDGSQVLMDMANPMGGVARYKTPSGKVLDNPNYAGYVPPSLKPEQLVTARNEFNRQFYNPVMEVVGNYLTVEELIKSGGSGISDYGVLIKAIKALEPTSAVMQGEADSARAMMSLASQMEAALKKASEGGLGSDEARLQLANLARSATKIAVNVYNRKLERERNGYRTSGASDAWINANLTPIDMPAGVESMAAMQQRLAPEQRELTNVIPGLAEAQAAAPSGSAVKMEQGTNKLAYDLDGKRYYWNQTRRKWETN